MKPLLPRHLLAFAIEALAAFPAIIIQGARQVGKSTFAAQLMTGRRAHLITLDDTTTRTAALEAPEQLVQQAPDHTLVIDEVQRVPELLLAIKAAIDQRRRPGQFMLTGSTNLLRLPSAPESLAGRAATIGLRGFSEGEREKRTDDFISRVLGWSQGGAAVIPAAAFMGGLSRAEYIERIARGSYPEVAPLSANMRNVWFDSYLQRLLERDIADISPAH